MSNPDGITALILGATGMVGIETLHHCLADDRITRVFVVGRQSTGVASPKLTEIEHRNFLVYASLKGIFAEVDVCYHCLGVYQGKVPTAKFEEITCDYLERLVDSLEASNPEITFCLFSAQGADTTGKSRLLFARAKGRAENYVMKSGLKAKYIFRPGYIHPGRRRARSRIPFWLVVPFYKLLPRIGIDARALAGVMVETGLDGDERTLFENKDIRIKAARLFNAG